MLYINVARETSLKFIHTVLITYSKWCENLKFLHIIYSNNLVKGFGQKFCKELTLQKLIMYHTFFL